MCLLLQYLSYYKAVRVGGGDRGGHLLRETTSQCLCGLVCPSRTSEGGGEGDRVKEGGGILIWRKTLAVTVTREETPSIFKRDLNPPPQYTSQGWDCGLPARGRGRERVKRVHCRRCNSQEKRSIERAHYHRSNSQELLFYCYGARVRERALSLI